MEFTNQIKKYIRSLHLNKYRQKYNKFLAEGPKICKEFIDNDNHEIEYVLASKEWIDENQISLKNMVNNRVITLKVKELASISMLKSASDIIIVATPKSMNTIGAVGKWGIYLEKLQDPGNMGTILRIADWYGIESVISSTDSVSFYNPKVIQSAMGAHNRVGFGVKPLSDLVQRPLYGMFLGGTNINQLDNCPPGYIVIGNESRGLSEESKALIGTCCTIPRLGGAESLNAAVACGIACHHFLSK